MRAWIHAEENKRRTLQRSDIASALSKSDMFDFLIDIVPREEVSASAKRATGGGGAQAAGVNPTVSQQIPPANVPQQPGHSTQQHAMGPPDYLGAHGIGQEQDYSSQPGMYGGAVQTGTASAYGQAPQQMYGGDVYAYNPMAAQQVCYCALCSLLKQRVTLTNSCFSFTICHNVARTLQAARIQLIPTPDMMVGKGMLTQKVKGIMRPLYEDISWEQIMSGFSWS